LICVLDDVKSPSLALLLKFSTRSVFVNGRDFAAHQSASPGDFGSEDLPDPFLGHESSAERSMDVLSWMCLLKQDYHSFTALYVSFPQRAQRRLPASGWADEGA
jgi:hypothetical protein